MYLHGAISKSFVCDLRDFSPAPEEVSLNFLMSFRQSPFYLQENRASFDDTLTSPHSALSWRAGFGILRPSLSSSAEISRTKLGAGPQKHTEHTQGQVKQVQIHTYAHIHTCHPHIHTHAHTYIHTHAHRHTCPHAHTCIHTHAHTCIHTHTHTHMQTHAHICTHTYAHTHMHSCLLTPSLYFLCGNDSFCFYPNCLKSSASTWERAVVHNPRDQDPFWAHRSQWHK